MSKKCPKCGGIIQQGGVRYGQWAPELASCLICGLHSEQAAFYDAKIEAYRSMEPPHNRVSRMQM